MRKAGHKDGLIHGSCSQEEYIAKILSTRVHRYVSKKDVPFMRRQENWSDLSQFVLGPI